MNNGMQNDSEYFADSDEFHILLKLGGYLSMRGEKPQPVRYDLPLLKSKRKG